MQLAECRHNSKTVAHTLLCKWYSVSQLCPYALVFTSNGINVTKHKAAESKPKHNSIKRCRDALVAALDFVFDRSFKYCDPFSNEKAVDEYRSSFSIGVPNVLSITLYSGQFVFQEGTSHSVLSGGCSTTMLHHKKRDGRVLKVWVLLSGRVFCQRSRARKSCVHHCLSRVAPEAIDN